ncbi:MAG: hypothetical protein ABI210_10790 [Abditibacteriaceae bacterium]
MNCTTIQSKICELSVDSLSARDASNMLEHFAACASCQDCWEEYQQTMFVLSTATQPIPAKIQSQQMWSHCQQRITESEIDSRYSSPAHAALRNSINETAGNNLWGWIGGQPRWSWIALGGAMTILAGAWFATTPSPNSTNNPPISSAQLFTSSNLDTVGFPPAPATSAPTLNLPSFDSNSPTVFAAPTTPASQFVENHSIVQGNPLEDAAASSVVSYTVPVNTAPTNTP